jgi:hypothetical protein
MSLEQSGQCASCAATLFCATKTWVMVHDCDKCHKFMGASFEKMWFKIMPALDIVPEFLSAVRDCRSPRSTTCTMSVESGIPAYCQVCADNAVEHCATFP